jgi:hypothetical protein
VSKPEALRRKVTIPRLASGGVIQLLYGVLSHRVPRNLCRDLVGTVASDPSKYEHMRLRASSLRSGRSCKTTGVGSCTTELVELSKVEGERSASK